MGRLIDDGIYHSSSVEVVVAVEVAVLHKLQQHSISEYIRATLSAESLQNHTKRGPHSLFDLGGNFRSVAGSHLLQIQDEQIALIPMVYEDTRFIP